MIPLRVSEYIFISIYFDTFDTLMIKGVVFTSLVRHHYSFKETPLLFKYQFLYAISLC